MRTFPDPFGPTPEEALADVMDAFEFAEINAARELRAPGWMRANIDAGHSHKGFVHRSVRRGLSIRHPLTANGNRIGSYVSLRNVLTGVLVRLPFA